MFDAFLFPEFSEAVAATKRKNIVIGGLMTEGCVLQTALGGARAGYQVYIAVDACGGQSKEIHDSAIQRLTASGIKPVTTFALASEFQMDQSLPGADRFYKLMESSIRTDVPTRFVSNCAEGRSSYGGGSEIENNIK